MRRLLLPALPLLLAACESGALFPPPEPVAAAASATQLRVGFPTGGVTGTIVVDAVDPLPLRAAELIAPDGAITPAAYIDAAASPGFAAGQRTVGNPWQNSIAGERAIPALAVQNTQASAALESREQLLATVSTADITLPDPVVYRRNWTRYRIRLIFGTPPAAGDVRLLPAPAPPPGS